MAKRKEFFDSYRGLGACVICLYHYLNTFGLEGCTGSRVYDLLFDIKNIGYVMVEFFYFTSGYLIFELYREKIQNNEIGLFSFMKKRISRIYPMFFWTTMIQIILEMISKKQVTLFDMVTNILLLQCGIFEGNGSWRNDINGVTWFIVPLLLCYLLFYLITRKIKNNEYYYLTIVSIIVLSMSVYNWDRINIPFINSYVVRGIMGFYMGIIFCHLEGKIKKKNLRYIIIGIVVLVILYKEIQADTYGAFQLVTLIDLVAIPAILYITENISGVKKVIENKIFVFLGKISMEIYYIHWLIMTVLTWWIKEGNVNTKEYLGLLLITIGIAAVVKKTIDKYIKIYKTES